MTRNLKKREALVEDRLLALSVLMSMKAHPKPSEQHLIRPFQMWLEDCDEQLATYAEDGVAMG